MYIVYTSECLAKLFVYCSVKCIRRTFVHDVTTSFYKDLLLIIYVMVGLVNCVSLSPIDNNLKKMSDSTAKDEVVEEKSEEKPLSNGNNGDSSATKDQPENESSQPTIANEEVAKMDASEVKKEEDNPVKKEEESEDTTIEAKDKSALRKKRSSRSHSSNSSSTSAVKTEETIDQDEKVKGNSSEEEDFYGFESPDSDGRLNPINFLKLAADSESGLETPSTSIIKRAMRNAKKSLNVDLSNPAFKKPFEYGWVRELVYRSVATETSINKRNGDVYYFAPSGKKVRSSRELLGHLHDGLTPDNFTFFKEPIGLNDPTKEIIREAKAKPTTRGSIDEPVTPVVKKAAPKVKAPLSSSKSTPKDVKTVTPKVVFKGNTTSKAKQPSGAKSKLDKKRKSAGPDDVDMLMDASEWSPESSPKINKCPAGHLPRDVCSIECRLAMGLIPSLNCETCLCLFHPECVGHQKDKWKPTGYICKSCQVIKGSLSKDPLAPAVTPKVPSVTKQTANTAKTIQPPAVSVPLSATPRPGGLGIVGAVTTWLAPSSSIQVTPQETPSVPTAEAPQGIVSMAGKQFVYVPRHNIVNVNTHQPSSEGEGPVSRPPGLFLVPCDPHQLPNGPHSASLANGLKRSLDSPTEGSTEKKLKTDSKDDKSDESDDASGVTSTDNGSCEVPASGNNEETVVNISPPSFMMQLNAGFNTLLHAFQFLKVNELLRASCVSRVWNMVASHHSLWEVVRMKNSKVSNWQGFGRKLNYHSTKVLDLRKMLVPESPEEQVKMWEDLVKAVEQVKSIVKVDMGRCSPAAFTAMAVAMPQLESLVSLAIKGNEIDLSPVINCINLTELKLKAVSGGLEIKDLSCLKDLKNLKTLGLTTIKNLKGIEDYLPEGLVSLELGECSQLSKSFASDALPRLTNLKRLRLEKGQNDCPTMALLDAVSSLPLLTQLELINFDIKPGFDKAIAKCTNLKTLLIIPTYVTQSATTNHVVMGGVAKLSHTLTYFIWGLTLELLKVTDLFIGQVENQKSGKVAVNPPKKGNGDSIPILKPSQESDLKEGGGQAPSQVDILALPNLQRVLSTLLPTTKIKILKVPFSATWRQTVTDGPSSY